MERSADLAQRAYQAAVTSLKPSGPGRCLCRTGQFAQAIDTAVREASSGSSRAVFWRFAQEDLVLYQQGIPLRESAP
jgi:hypothetical protein